MWKFLSSAFIFVFWILFIVFLYYTQNASQTNILSKLSKENVLPTFLIVIFIVYGLYKAIQYTFNKKYTMNFWTIIISFLFILFLICIFYGFVIGEQPYINTNPFVLFFHIIQFLVYPLFLVLLWRAIGASTLTKNKNWQEYPLKLTIPVETALGLGIFSTFLLLLGFLKIYTLPSLFGLLFLLSIASWSGWKKIWNNIKQVHISVEKENIFSTYILSAEMSFIIFSIVGSVSLINALRPMPIGWDDLGVYMNFPRIMAETGGFLEGAGMYIWHLITGTGFLFHEASQAFFINQIGGFLTTISIICSISLLLEIINKKRKNLPSSFLCLPLLLGIIYYTMPMTVFQQALDMKLDPALMFVSVTTVSSLLYASWKFLEKESNKKNIFILFFIAGILTGIAFGIKFTTLMLIFSGLAFISYIILGFLGFIGFCGICIASFTQFHLWSNLFVWMPENTTSIVLISLFIGILSYIFAFFKKQKNIHLYIQISGIFIFGMFLAVLPWLMKNFYELKNHNSSTSIVGLLNGKGGTFEPDFTKIFSEEEYKKRTESTEGSSITGNGQSLNEDLSRYFGQEAGLNNYAKLPFNLTMQVNQKGEFTDITFIFLAFVPVSLLFFRVRRSKKGIEGYSIVWILGIIGFLLLGVLSSFQILRGIPCQQPSIHCLPAHGTEFGIAPYEKGAKIFENLQGRIIDVSDKITTTLSQIQLPTGYAILLGLVLCFLILVEFCIKSKSSEEKITKGLLFFLALYGLIFWVSAFGIVWYGVLIYFLMILIIAIALNSLNHPNIEQNKDYGKIILLAFVVMIFGTYFGKSTLPYTWRNLERASYNEFKYQFFPQNVNIGLYKSAFLPSLLALNLKDTQPLIDDVKTKISKTFFKDTFNQLPKEYQNNPLIIDQILKNQLFQILEQINQIHQSKSISNNENTILQQLQAQKKEIISILDTLYSGIFSPQENNTNNGIIYRIGTFMTYFIQNNRARYYDDSLIINFQKYFYDKNPDKTIEKMQKLGMKFLLIDLNAATIDNDARMALTTRYENLLTTLLSPKLELVDTDNICLRVAFDAYKQKDITTKEEFLSIAGTNYGRGKNFQEKGRNKKEKQQNCINFIDTMKKEKREEYPYLEHITQQQLPPTTTYFALFKILN